MIRRTTRFARLAPLVGLTGLIAGCSSAPDGLIGDLSPRQLFAPTAIPRPVGPGEALARLPGEAGRMVSVNETRADGEVWQRIVLAGDLTTRGENGIEVHLGRGTEAVRRPTDREIHREMLERLPGVAMAPSTSMLRTRQGPLGMAYGRSGRQGCLYAWQYLDGTEDGVRSIWTVTDRPVVASVRVRLCRDGLDPAGAEMIASNLVVGAGAGAYAGGGQMDALAFVDPLRGLLAPAAPMDPEAAPPPRRARPAAPPLPATAAAPAPTLGLPVVTAPTVTAPPIPLPTGVIAPSLPTRDAGLGPVPAQTLQPALPAIPKPAIPAVSPPAMAPVPLAPPVIPLPVNTAPSQTPVTPKPIPVPSTTASIPPRVIPLR
jgi:hypothetical protein